MTRRARVGCASLVAALAMAIVLSGWSGRPRTAVGWAGAEDACDDSVAQDLMFSGAFEGHVGEACPYNPERLNVEFYGISPTGGSVPFTVPTYEDPVRESGEDNFEGQGGGRVTVDDAETGSARRWTTRQGSGQVTFTATGGSVDVELYEVGGGPSLRIVGEWADPESCNDFGYPEPLCETTPGGGTGSDGVPFEVVSRDSDFWFEPSVAGAPDDGTPAPVTTSRPTTRERESDGSGASNPWIFIALILLGLAAVGSGLWFMRPRTKERPPKAAPAADDEDSVPEEEEPEIPIEEIGDKVEEVPPPVKVSKDEEPPCECSGYIVISGRDTLRVCECLNLTWETAPFEPEYELISSAAGHQSVRGLFSDGKVFCDRFYWAEGVIAECTGGGSIPAGGPGQLHDLTWQVLQSGPDTLTLRCQANVKITCPKTGVHDQRVDGEMTIKLVKAKCQVSLVINQDDYWNKQTGHTGVRIRCGEYDTIFGFYPDSITKGEALFGDSVSGYVKVQTSCSDPLPDQVSLYYASLVRREYIFDVSCQDCERLRRKWTALGKKPGDFDLYGNNCTVTAVKFVEDVVKLPAKVVANFFDASSLTIDDADDPDAPFGFQSPATLNECLEKGGFKPVIHAAGQPFHPKDHDPVADQD